MKTDSNGRQTPKDRLIFINNKIRGLKQKCHFFSNSSQQKHSKPPRESFEEILEEIPGGNLECGSAQPSLFINPSQRFGNSY